MSLRTTHVLGLIGAVIVSPGGFGVLGAWPHAQRRRTNAAPLR